MTAVKSRPKRDATALSPGQYRTDERRLLFLMERRGETSLWRVEDSDGLPLVFTTRQLQGMRVVVPRG